MIIKLGDMITDKKGRVGELINIGIATEMTDVAAENETALNAKQYNTELGYKGAITFGSHWCYFDDIKNVTTKEDSDIDVAVNQEAEWWK